MRAVKLVKTLRKWHKILQLLWWSKLSALHFPVLLIYSKMYPWSPLKLMKISYNNINSKYFLKSCGY